MSAGYSGTPLPKKLGIKEGHRVLLSSAPEGFERVLGALPLGAMLHTSGGSFHVILWFVTERATVSTGLAAHAACLDKAGGLWLCWPKKASGVQTDVTEDGLRELILPSGLVDNKVCAVDDTWSGLRFVLRKALR